MRTVLNILFGISLLGSYTQGNYTAVAWIFNTIIWCNMYYESIKK